MLPDITETSRQRLSYVPCAKGMCSFSAICLATTLPMMQQGTTRLWRRRKQVHSTVSSTTAQDKDSIQVLQKCATRSIQVGIEASMCSTHKLPATTTFQVEDSSIESQLPYVASAGSSKYMTGLLPIVCEPLTELIACCIVSRLSVEVPGGKDRQRPGLLIQRRAADYAQSHLG